MSLHHALVAHKNWPTKAPDIFVKGGLDANFGTYSTGITSRQREDG